MKEKKDTKKLLVILDAHAIIHRAYHALPSFTARDGRPTGALYGLATMLMRIITELKPDYVVAAYDLPKPTFRHAAYEAYKGTRVKADEALKEQLAASRKVFEAFSISCLDAEGFEADDVIGTLTEQFKKEKNISIVIASGDMDTLSLVSGKKVQVYTLKKGINDTILYDQEAVEARFGFPPSAIADFKALRGDPSDNIIGVPGIGEKTASLLVQEFGSIENLYQALKKDPERVGRAGVSPRIVDLLKAHEEDARFSKTLATIRRDAPVSFDLPKNRYTDELNVAALLDLCTAYEFRSLVPRVKALAERLQGAGVLPQEKEGAPLATTPVDQKLLKEASVALWVLRSEHTNPALETILSLSGQKTLEDAYRWTLEALDREGTREVFEHIEKPIIPLVEAMERHGVLVDQAHFKEATRTYQARLERLESAIVEMAGVVFNINSPKQLSQILFEELKLAPKGTRKKTGAYTTNAGVLETLRGSHPIVDKVLEYREVQKLLSTYLLAIPEKIGPDGRLHARFIQHGAATGRFSSTDPNLQNLPAYGEGGKDIRRGLIAAPGNVLLSCDYAQIELRVLATLSGDARLIESFNEGHDIHASVAAFMFKVPLSEVTEDMRRRAKVINFGILYGMGITALQKNLAVSRAEAQRFYQAYFEALPSVTGYLDALKKESIARGYTETLFGRRRYIPGINASAPALRAFAERMATNAPIQGTAADLIKLAIQAADLELKKSGLGEKVFLVMQIHDELVYEVPEGLLDRATKIIVRAMEEAVSVFPIKKSLLVPLAVSTAFGKNLGDLG